MMGSRTDPGLIPRLCNELFARISQPDAEKKINYSGPDRTTSGPEVRVVTQPLSSNMISKMSLIRCWTRIRNRLLEKKKIPS